LGKSRTEVANPDHEKTSLSQAMSVIEAELDFRAGIEPVQDDAISRFREVLARHIAQLLANDPERLKWLLYRIDVPEQQVAQALADNEPGKVPSAIAQLMITRQLEKVQTRQQYRQHGKGDWD
jgi:hypothetical protein